MIPYAIAGVIAVVLLYAAYRTFGGAESQPADPAAMLRAALETASDVARELRDSSPGDLAPVTGKDRDRSRSARRRLDGAAQLLQQIETGKLDDSAAAAHALLTVSVDELSWSLRLRQSPGYEAGAGMHAAVDALQHHAERCVHEAQALMPGSGAAEEVHSAT